MAAITKGSSASMDATSIMFLIPVHGVAGEDIAICDACYLKGADNKVWRASGAAINEAARLLGFAPKAVKAGDPIECFGVGTKMNYTDSGVNLTPGAMYYLGAAGGLDSASQTGDTVGVVQAIDAHMVRVTKVV